jgi:hypothetical protein
MKGSNMTEKPQSFDEVDIDLLIQTAVEDWAVDVKPSDSRKVVVKALEDGGVDWEEYAGHYGYLDSEEETPPEPVVIERTPEPIRQGAVATLSNPVTEDQLPTRNAAPAKPVVRTAQPLQTEEGVPYLVKMERSNPLYQTRGHTFTKDHPYALVSGEDLEWIMKHEKGFRQALPSEAREFYS